MRSYIELAQAVKKIIITNIILIFIFGCQAPSAAEPRITYILVDLSGSVTVEARKRYYCWFERILDQLEPGDRIALEAIRKWAAGSATFPINEQLPPFNPLFDNRFLHNRKLKNKKREILTEAKKFIFSEKSPRTEIMSALIPVAQFFGNFPEISRRTLVIMSDMVEDSSRYNFNRLSLTPSRIRKIIAAEKKAGRMPNLKGLRVYVTGATAETRKFLQIKNFWLQYFRACGAELRPENYGAGLVRFGH